MAVCALLREAVPDLQIAVFGGEPSRVHQVIGEEAHRLSLRSLSGAASLAALVRRADAVLIGGGGLLQDNLPHFYRRYCLLALIAKLLRRPVMFYAVGVYPPNTRIFRESLRLVLNQADIVTVRDQFSADAIASAGIRREVTVTPDPAITLRPTFPSTHRNGERPLIGVSLRPWYNHAGARANCGSPVELARTLAQCLDRVVDRTGAGLLFFPMHFGTVDDDQRWQTQVLALMRRAEAAERVAFPSPLETQATIAGCDLVLGMRLHANVLAAAVGVPSIAFAYDPKVREFMRNLGCGDRVLNLDEIEPEDVAKRVVALLDNRENACNEIRRRVETLSASARSCAQLALRLADCAFDASSKVALEVRR
jgi:polysaccharide pyruvyl transferase CsaB